MGRVPPGRTAILQKSASFTVFSIGVIRWVLSVVNDETPVRPESTELPPVGTALGALEPPEPPLPVRIGSRYSTGIGTQLLEFGNVPCLRSATIARNSGLSTPE